MNIPGPDRRAVVAGGLAAGFGAPVLAGPAEAGAMYGLIGKMTAKPGERAALAAILLDGVSGMPGCLSYVVAEDPADADVLWITEAWESQDAHRASLSLPSVQAAIAQGRPLIAGMDTIAETRPLGGHGLG
ncbi:putative quinol monooxygenase [Phenylobacterium sp.]|uniref:putative quinol monooxygenase n=1 Tax=Phenylobacterium sp. TaxID=1871053 RepID=UPI0025D45EEC|nr:putative quinol monooxygenase [Phenylobacterium sp.]